MKRCLALILGLMILVMSVPAQAVSFTFDQASGFVDSINIDGQVIFTGRVDGHLEDTNPLLSLPNDVKGAKDIKGGLFALWSFGYPSGLLGLSNRIAMLERFGTLNTKAQIQK